MILNIVKLDETVNSTISKFLLGTEFLCFILEDGGRSVKEYGNTRIPGGTYKLEKRRYGRFYEKYKLNYKHQFVWEIKDVFEFSDILIHIGNFTKDTKGCLLPNSYIGMDRGNYIGVNSKAAYFKLFDALKNENSHILNIIR